MALGSFLTMVLMLREAIAVVPQGPGLEWLGINGGFSEDYVDHLGRRWHHTKEKWTPTGWGGYVAFKPRDYTNTAYLNGNQSLGRMRCRNWPAEYEPDYDALLQHYSREADAPNQTFRANLQDASAKVSYYTVKYQFCEKNRNGGAKMNIMINGKLVKRDFTTSCHHTITDIYHFKCIPTQSGMIEVSIQGDPTAKKPQARFSTLEFEKSLDGCGECELSCGVNGFCSSSSHYENPYSCGDRGSEFLHNEFDPEKLRSNASCACGSGVQGDFCELGVCAKTSCNEPFGGVCLNGTCACLSGYAGRSCERPPETDQFGCYSQEEVYGPLTVSTICLPELIAGPARHGHLFRGPSPMQGVSDRTKADTVYFSWTADTKYGKRDAAGSEGRVYASKLKIGPQGAAILESSVAFEGFVRAGGVDVTEDGVLGMLCAKYWHPWVEHTNSHLDKAAMVLAVCEVNTSTMTRQRTPWQIGKQYQESTTAPNTGIWGSYPLTAWFAQRSAGYGYLLYAPAQQLWTAWYGATVGSHTGFAMHTYHRDAPEISQEEYAKYTYPVPREMVELREEAEGPWRDHHRTGTGDHQASAAWRYHPRLKDIGLQKHTHGPVYMQQYGLANGSVGQLPAGEFANPGHKTGRLEMLFGEDTGIQANALRPCGEDWIVGIIAKVGGNVCAKVTRLGEITTWKSIEPSVGKMPCGSSGGACGDGAKGRMLRIAPLGSSEEEALCGATARFLFGYEKEDRTRWLVEVDGDCNEISEKMDVTQSTHWPLYQDWTTTTAGEVVWVTTWQADVKGSFGPVGSPNGVWPYKPKPQLEEEEYLFDLTPEATNAAKVTVYSPWRGTTTSMSSTASSSTLSTTVVVISTSIWLLSGFQPAEGGEDRACRGASASDNHATYYVVVEASSLEACQHACLDQPLCSGVEYSPGRCEVWTRPGGIRSTKPLRGFSCYRLEPPGAFALRPVDGGHRACRGQTASDNSPEYMKVLPIGRLFDCKAACLQDPDCTGIEFSLGRCEVWTRSIHASAEISNFTCLALEGPSFREVNGPGQACRGAHKSDNLMSYYEVVPDTSLDACMWSCTGRLGCSGVEFSQGRCEVWSQQIQATIALEGFACLRYAPVLQNLQSFIRKRRQHFLGLLQTSSKENLSRTKLEGASEEL
ncbi:unnamed protein product [Durusdinium trenchii]|uniref:EGF-like domain-containing protein n=1 Tax=Durusdinium trenchii TaxID=1381693 RepID=A0ABP0JF12_9DINO